SETCSTSLWAVSLLLQNSGDAIRTSTSVRRRVRAGKSKKPPQLGNARRDGGGVDRFELFNHRVFCAGLVAFVGSSLKMVSPSFIMSSLSRAMVSMYSLSFSRR